MIRALDTSILVENLTQGSNQLVERTCDVCQKTSIKKFYKVYKSRLIHNGKTYYIAPEHRNMV